MSFTCETATAFHKFNWTPVNGLLQLLMVGKAVYLELIALQLCALCLDFQMRIWLTFVVSLFDNNELYKNFFFLLVFLWFD